MSKRAVLLVNLGSPDSTSVPDVRRYLREFLGDERVIDKPGQPFRWMLVNWIITKFRAPKSAHAYEQVWTEKGSPLIVTSESVAAKLRDSLGADMPVYLAMRYGTPSIPEIVARMAADGVTQVLLMPQYPHYAMSSWETVVVRVYEEFAARAPKVRVDCIQPFYSDTDYIDALVASAAPHLEQPHDYVLFSFHGIPVRHLQKADGSHGHCTIVPDCCTTCSPIHETCYKAQVLATTRAFVAKTGIPDGKWSVSFQSRLAGEPWLSPYTDYELTRLAKEGKKRLLVLSPAFVADCLETLEEIAGEGKETFMHAGGEWFLQIPCLNDHPGYIAFLAGRVQAWAGGKQPAGAQRLQPICVSS